MVLKIYQQEFPFLNLFWKLFLSQRSIENSLQWWNSPHIGIQNCLGAILASSLTCIYRIFGHAFPPLAHQCGCLHHKWDESYHILAIKASWGSRLDYSSHHVKNSSVSYASSWLEVLIGIFAICATIKEKFTGMLISSNGALVWVNF